LDMVTPGTRSRMMSGIRGKNTKPEILVRKILHAAGFRFRLHRHDLPGSPDIVLPKYRLVIFVHGCFWHMHAGCKYSTMPSTRTDFWKKKLGSNRDRDRENIQKLLSKGWRVLVVWECFFKASHNDDKDNRSLTELVQGESTLREVPFLGSSILREAI
jgi:DNA mismatch endonuclease (patch repair protein)